MRPRTPIRRAGRSPATEIPAAGRLLLTNEFGLIALIAIFGAIFALGTPGFSSQFNLFTLGRTTAIDIMIGFSMMVVIVTGGLNLSVGAIGVCAAMAMGWLLERVGLPLPLAIVGRARARRRARRGQRRADRPLRVAQLHHHAGDDERIFRRDGLHQPRTGVSQPAARDCRIREDADRRLRLGAADCQRCRRFRPDRSSIA